MCGESDRSWWRRWTREGEEAGEFEGAIGGETREEVARIGAELEGRKGTEVEGGKVEENVFKGMAGGDGQGGEARGSPIAGAWPHLRKCRQT